jgi:hypothetical protein
VTTAPDGSLVAAWMQDEGYDIYIRYARSTDGGQTWSTPEYIDQDAWGYQNDPVVITGGGYVYFTWLAIEGRNYDVGNIYCMDSTDGGVTWSDKVKLTADGDNDREWLATDPSGRAVITWDTFTGRSETQQYTETAGGCAGFATPVDVAEGSFLNGVPAIGADGTVWLSRNDLESRGKITVTHLVDDAWTDVTLFTYPYPGFAPRMARKPISAGKRYALARAGVLPLPEHDSANGTYDGETSPVVYVRDDGSLAVTALVTESGSADADVYFFTYDGTNTTDTIVNQDGGGAAQFEPWMVQDDGGGLHLVWFDGREDAWRLYGASSLDGGASFTEYTVGDSTFQNGFDETDRYYNAWVGHYQGMTTMADSVVTVFGDSRTSDTSWIYADVSVP